MMMMIMQAHRRWVIIQNLIFSRCDILLFHGLTDWKYVDYNTIRRTVAYFFVLLFFHAQSISLRFIDRGGNAVDYVYNLDK